MLSFSLKNCLCFHVSSPIPSPLWFLACQQNSLWRQLLLKSKILEKKGNMMRKCNRFQLLVQFQCFVENVVFSFTRDHPPPVWLPGEETEGWCRVRMKPTQMHTALCWFHKGFHVVSSEPHSSLLRKARLLFHCYFTVILGRIKETKSQIKKWHD